MDALVTVRRSLGALCVAGGRDGRWIADESGRQAPATPADTAGLRHRVVLIATAAQLPAVRAMLALDGIARRILLCPPDLAAAYLPAIMAEAEVDFVLTDGAGPLDAFTPPAMLRRLEAGSDDGARDVDTEWVLFTSGTTGQPKLVQHGLPGLTGPLADGLGVTRDAVWSTFYDVRRYGGLTILLRALLGGGSMVLSAAGEPAAAFLSRAGQAGVTHISGTPSHWRRALMSGATDRMAPRYVRLSGEIADQAILDQLAQAWPQAEVAHAFASTEAGVAFDVRDGRAGFPAAYVGRPASKEGAPAELRVEDGTLRIRSARTADRYLGPQTLAGADGFVDTGDRVELRGDRYCFLGRREGVINVGGQKVHPEEVEAIINRLPGVRMSRVWARKSPITGAVVAADIMTDGAPGDIAALRDAILAACRAALPPYKVPVTVRAVDVLPINPAGKLVRGGA